MSNTYVDHTNNETDRLLIEIADYALNKEIDSKIAYDISRYMVMDSIASGMLALNSRSI
jgi:2-methylcitrate dehydratase PrpD